MYIIREGKWQREGNVCAGDLKDCKGKASRMGAQRADRNDGKHR